ncbi:SLAM family member 9-like [Alosa sapidissima]|uniref:SLAM family member 9-like n=1 Tax=Alosa sapidissima TaxID=34773 RepID=UPI001C0A5E5F|nr:SLAM family member 9-like [Alosa sapidissima]
MIPLLVLSLHKVASAPESLFALEKHSVTFNMKTNDNLDPDVAIWTFNQSSDVVRYYPHYPKSRQLRVTDPYKGRVEFNRTTFSLELKNLMKNDSGLYIGEINEWAKTVVGYRLFVYEQVSAPILTVGPVLSSGDLCNMTVTCTAGDLSLTSICNSSTCIQKKLTASSSLAIFIRDGIIVCNHTNSVGWKHATVETEAQCRRKQCPSALSVWIWIAVGGLCVTIVIAGVCCWVKRLEKRNYRVSAF